MRNILFFTLVFFAIYGFSQNSASKFENQYIKPNGMSVSFDADGYPVSNFSVSANVSSEGGLLHGVITNLGELDQWLEYKGKSSFSFSKDTISVMDNQFKNVDVKRLWPFTKVEASEPSLELKHSTKIWCPVVLNDKMLTSLPVIQIEMAVINKSKLTNEFWITWSLKDLINEEIKEINTDSRISIQSGDMIFSVKEKALWDNETKSIKIKVNLEKGKEKTIKFLLAFYDERNIVAQKYANVKEVADYTMTNWVDLRYKTLTFSQTVPKTGDHKIDEYMRMYMSRAINFTKVLKDNNVRIIDYKPKDLKTKPYSYVVGETNQRNDFWSSWIHLVYWPDLELMMMKNSIESVNENGGISLVNSSELDKKASVEATCYLILRMLRWNNYYKDDDFGENYWGQMKKALDYLLSEDVIKDGLPLQQASSFDWMNTKVAKKRYTPYTSLLYLSTIHKAYLYTEEIGDKLSSDRLKKAYNKAKVKVNTNNANGGLWSGEFYKQVSSEDEQNNQFFEDQVIGVLYGAVGSIQGTSILNKLMLENKCEFGIRSAFPYGSETLLGSKGEYFNGAVIPWLNYIDAWSRFFHDQRREGLQILKKTGFYDLEFDKTWNPSQYINAETGECKSISISSINSCFFAAIYFGLLSKDGIVP